MTNQPDIGAFDCQRLMSEVNAFRAIALEGWDGGPLEILVTGRSAYVAEISLEHAPRHHCHPARFNLPGRRRLLARLSALGAADWNGIFVAALLSGRARGRSADFRRAQYGHGRLLRHPHRPRRRFRDSRFRPLSTGARRRLRSSARSDRSGEKSRPRRFLRRPDHCGWIPRVVLSGSAGFTQLGVLIAIGIFLAGLLMTVFFLFLRATTTSRADLIFTLVKNYVHWMVRPAASFCD